VSKKSGKIAARIAAFGGSDLDAHYLGYFDCFNRQEFYEAHDVLEELWLADRHGPNGDFYKGLIQLAGAFVHLQKERLRPAAALFKLARTNLAKYPAAHERLDLGGVLALIEAWLGWLEAGDFARNPLREQPAGGQLKTRLPAGMAVVISGRSRRSTPAGVPYLWKSKSNAIAGRSTSLMSSRATARCPSQ
jgi:predicted metal-dependent hydrolase